MIKSRQQSKCNRRLAVGSLAAMLYFCMLAVAAAALEFEKTEVSHSVDHGVDELTVSFPFKNAGGDPVRIVSIVSGCDCLVADAPEEAVAPGEAGEVTALFKVGAFLGKTKRELEVVMESNGRQTRQVLDVVMDIPRLFEVEPNALTWILGGESAPQVIDFKVIGDEPISIVDVVSSQETFEVRVETVEEGRHYRLHVEPESTERAMMSLLQINTDSEYQKFRRHSSFATIRPE